MIATLTRGAIAAAMVVHLATVPAHAAGISNFTFAPPSGVNSGAFSFSLPTQPTPAFSSPNFFVINDVPALAGGVPVTLSFQFRTNASGGGVDVTAGRSPFYSGFGSLLFFLPTSAPTFTHGVFPLFTNTSLVATNGTLTISAAVVPAPAGLAILGVGLLGLAVLGRRRKAQGEEAPGAA